MNETSSQAVADRIQRALYETLDPLVPAGARVALTAYPSHTNIGDSFIWMGTLAYLRRRSVQVAYACDLMSYSPQQLRQRLGREGMIFMAGGGHLGDLWPQFEGFRERVIRDFPDLPILQLPQSMCFRGEETLARAKTAFERHPRLTLLLRDQASAERAHQAFAVPSALCPDMAFALGSLPRVGAPSYDMVWLIRQDAESRRAALPALGRSAVQAHWHVEPSRLRRGWLRTLTRQMRKHPRRLAWLSHVIAGQFEPLSRAKLSYGSRLLSQGQVVVTDYMHGHILAVLLGIPHVVLNNLDGKVRNFYDTWTKDCEDALWAATPEEALLKASALLGAPSSRGCFAVSMAATEAV